MVSPVHGDYRRCQAEIPLIVLCRFPGPALSTLSCEVAAMNKDDERIGQEELDKECDFLVSQILNASDREVLDNVRKLYGDENKLADETREIFRRGLTTHQINADKKASLEKTPAYVISPERSTLSRVSGASGWKRAFTGLTRLTEHMPWFTRRQIGLALALSTVSVAIIAFVGETFLRSPSFLSRSFNFPSKVSREQLANDHCYREAIKVAPDDKLDAYRLCAGRGDVLSQYLIGRLYEKGDGGLRPDDREAVRWYKRAAAQGYSFAQVALASFYENSRGGLLKDDHEAARLYSLAAAQGNPFAQMALASFYENGRGGLPKDKIYAESLLKAASEALAVAMVPGSER
jgi:hypothetical protein